MCTRVLFAIVLAAATVPVAHAQESADELAKKLSNPVASMISVPFQYNADFGYGSEDGTKQLAYQGKPLYTFVKDKKAGERTGDKKLNAWHVVTD